MLLEACFKSQEWDGESISTQHQLALLRETNENMAPYTRKEWSGDPLDIQAGGACLFSGDVVGLFPSLEVEVCAEAAGQTVARSYDQLQGVNLRHALVGLASANTPEINRDMARLDIHHLMPVRKYKKGTRPGEFTRELNQKAEPRRTSEVVDEGEAWCQQ